MRLDRAVAELAVNFLEWGACIFMAATRLFQDFFRDVKCLKTPIIAAFCITFFTYLYYCVNFTFGNHCWRHVIDGSTWNDLTFAGRPFSNLPEALLEGGVYLPVLGPVLSICFWFASGVILLLLFRIPASGKAAFFYALALYSLSPTLIGRLYYDGADLGVTFGMLTLAAGVWLSARGTRKFSFFSAVLLLFYTFGSSPCFLNTVWVILIFMLLYKLLFNINNRILRYVSALCIALPAYYVYIKMILRISDNYNNHFGSIGRILNNILPELKMSALYPFLTQPPMDWWYKTFYAAFFFGAITLFIKSSFVRPSPLPDNRTSLMDRVRPGAAVFTVILLLCVYLLHNPSGLLSGELVANTTQIRIDFFSIPLILAMCVLMVSHWFASAGRWRHCLPILAAIFILLSMRADIRATQVWKISLDDELFYANRLLMRIEAQPGFDASQSWKYLQLGARPIYGSRFFKNYRLTTYELQRPLHIVQQVHYVFNYIAPNLRIGRLTKPPSQICAQYRDFLASAQAYPKEQSILVDDGVIIVVLDEQIARSYCAPK